MKLCIFVLFFGLTMGMRLSTPSFTEFMSTFGKVYDSDDEHNRRYWIFLNNMAKWNLLNLQEQGSAQYGPTQFADLTVEEFRQLYLSPITDKDMWYFEHDLVEAEDIAGPMAASVDWRKKGVVTPVKNQGQCGSCWAFSTTGNIEGQWAIAKGKLYSLSEQELLDCDKVDLGCDGGLPYQAYEEIIRLGGLETEKDYPYEAEGGRCRLNKSKIVVKITGREKVSSDEVAMAKYVAKNGPVSIGINAENMQFYRSGIANPSKSSCNPAELDHGVLIVGYGTEGGMPYWIIKNSWGTGWGEDGYYRVHRGVGACGLNRMVTSAKV